MLMTACLPAAAEPKLIGEGTPVLFIGNSQTYVNDVPGIVQALADSAGGERLAVMTSANANYALIDHWNGGEAQRVIASRRWSHVVLQQGWTPAGVCRDTLRLATGLFAPVIRSSLAEPALLQTWPPIDRPNQWLGTIESYRLAAADVNGVLFPVAEAWEVARARDPSINLYSDGLHANQAGSYLAALVIYARLLHKSPVGLPARLRTRAGASIAISDELASLLQDVAAEVGLSPTPKTEPTAAPVLTTRC